jgi:hypothetical protein
MKRILKYFGMCALCQLVNRHWYFEGSYCLYFQGQVVPELLQPKQGGSMKIEESVIVLTNCGVCSLPWQCFALWKPGRPLLWELQISHNVYVSFSCISEHSINYFADKTVQYATHWVFFFLRETRNPRTNSEHIIVRMANVYSLARVTGHLSIVE